METDSRTLTPPPGAPVTRGDVVLDLADRFRELVTGLPAHAWSRPVTSLPGWSVHHLVAHVAGVAPLYLEGLQDATKWISSPGEVAGVNARRLRDWMAVSRAELIDALQRSPREVTQVIDRDPEALTPFHCGSVVPCHIVSASLVGEFAVHGWDLAHALDLPWAFPPEHADAVLCRNVTMFDVLMDPRRAARLRATFELVVRRGHRYPLTISDGHAFAALPDDARVDCRITATPEAWLLGTHGRRAPFRYAVTGQMRATGWRPWLAARLPTLVPRM